MVKVEDLRTFGMDSGVLGPLPCDQHAGGLEPGYAGTDFERRPEKCDF